jgi:hypothetical protein
MSVVTIAIITIIVNRVGVIMPRSRPIFKMISSISPRAFIKEPIAIAYRLGSPFKRAASQQATPLPRQADSTASKVMLHNKGVSTKPIWVFRPE